MLRYSRKFLAAAAAVFATSTAACSMGAAASAASKATSGAEQFQVFFISTKSFAPGGASSLIATGAIAGGGKAVTIAYGTTWSATFKLPGGSFKIAESAGSGTGHLDRATCIYSQHWSGTFMVGHGTGKYAGITGHGTYRYDWLQASAKSNGHCEIMAPNPLQVVTHFSGNVSF